MTAGWDRGRGDARPCRQEEEPVGIAEIVISVGDVDEAVTFYSEVCGFDVVRRLDEPGGAMAELTAGGQRVTLVASSRPGVRLALGVRDVDGARERVPDSHLLDSGELPVEVPGGRWLGFTDPWGNPLGFWQDGPTSADD